jgi:hypothetical protein
MPGAGPASGPVNVTTDPVLEKALASLKAELGSELHSCCLYGSAVRGNAIAGVSDLNLLIVLNESNSTTHQAVTRALKGFPKIDPFVLGRRGFERSVRAFGAKFSSIQRNYRVLAGADPLAGLEIDAAQERFLCEQALRNLRLRLVYSFVTREQHQRYVRFVTSNVTALFVHSSEVLRLEGREIPPDFAARIPLLAGEFQVEGEALRELLDLKKSPRKLNEAEIVRLHERTFPVIDAVLAWIEKNWPA